LKLWIYLVLQVRENQSCRDNEFFAGVDFLMSGLRWESIGILADLPTQFCATQIFAQMTVMLQNLSARSQI